MKYISLRQDYKELVALENLLLDCQRRLVLARENDFLSFGKNDAIHIVGSGFSAVLAFHALRSYGTVAGIYDPAGKSGGYDLPGVAMLPLEELPQDSEVPVLVACAPGMAGELIERVNDAAPGRERILLFASNDSANSIEPAGDSGWLRLNMSYRCVNIAVNLARRYRAVSLQAPSPVYVMGTGLAGLLAQLGLGMARVPFGGYAEHTEIPSDADLLVTYAEQTFAGKERELCEEIDCRSAQFLFRAGDDDIPGLSVDGFSDCRLLGSGEEGFVFDAVGPDGSRYCYKRYYEPQDRTDVLQWARSLADGPACLGWMGETRGVPGERAEAGICYPYEKLMHIPFMDEAGDGTLRALVAYALQYQQIHIAKGRVPATMPGGIHALCDESGNLRFVDIGNYPPSLSECEPWLVKGFVLKGLAGLTHETIFSGQGWDNLESDESLTQLRERLKSVGGVVPQWYVDLLREVLAMPAESFLNADTYDVLSRKYVSGTPALPTEVAVRAHHLEMIPFPGPEEALEGEAWFRECLYQGYRYREGRIEGTGRTGHKYSLIAEEFERIIPGSSYLDIGSNMGFFVASAALLTDKPCTGIEKRGEFRLQAERMFKAVGVANAKAIDARFQQGFPLPDSDVVSAFAVIHHLYLMDGTFPTFASMVGYLADAAKKALFIEYVFNPGYMERAEARHGRSFADYSEQGMVDALRQHFPSVKKVAEVSSSRIVYLATRG